MKTRNLILTVLGIVALVETSFAADPVGTIVSLSGKATATAKDATVRSLELKSPVMLNDKIKTEAGASLQMMFLDDSVLSLGEKSEMTIDEYVYNPKDKEDNKCMLNLTKGVFRAVTAKITAINPDRFRVKTKFATIGIRGCEVGFIITEKEENIYVLSLPDGKSIVITLNAGVDTSAVTTGGSISKENAIMIIKAGIMVQIEEGGGTTRRMITPQEAIDFLEELTGSGDSGSSVPPADNGNGTVNPDNPMSDEVANSGNEDGNGNDLAQTRDNTVEELADSQAGSSTSGSTSDTTAGTTPAVPPSGLQYTRQGTGQDWEWGIWSYPGDSVPTKVDFKGTSVLTDTEVMSLLSSSVTLSGMGGKAAAVISYNSQNYYVNGDCKVSVTTGSGSGSWQADTMTTTLPLSDGSGTSLRFLINGTIDSSGKLSGSVGSVDYNLTVGSQNYFMPETQTINASLVGAGGANPQPTGIIGRFNFTHDAGATTVNGGLGADLGVN